VIFADRADAGRRLARRLAPLRQEEPVVLGLPRGGVPVAYEVARELDAPLDVIVVRKLGVPAQPELAMGALGEDGVRVLDPAIVELAGVDVTQLAAVEARERAELERRATSLRGRRRRYPLGARTVIVVDDGIATGSTARAACRVARAHGAGRVVLAVPVGPPGIEQRLAGDADEVICLETPPSFAAVGQFYVDFSPTTDEEVNELLARAAAFGSGRPTAEPAATAATPAPVDASEVQLALPSATLVGDLTLPPGARTVVVFAHGSGSGRHSPRNRAVAGVLVQAGLGTLLLDLLTPDEAADRSRVFDVELLATRLAEATRWLQRRPGTAGVRIGYFGASTGAAAALWAAADPATGDVAAVVSRGGRPDLAMSRLNRVRAPTLLIVGSRDEVVLELNRRAEAELRCEHRLVIVEGASHLFEEPGTLMTAAELARDWFLAHP